MENQADFTKYSFQDLTALATFSPLHLPRKYKLQAMLNWLRASNGTFLTLRESDRLRLFKL